MLSTANPKKWLRRLHAWLGAALIALFLFFAITGFALNPARDFGPKLFTSLAGWGSIAFTGGLAIPYFLVPLLAPVVGAIIGAFLYRKLIGRHLPCECGIDE